MVSEIIHAPQSYEAKLLDKVASAENGAMLEDYARFLEGVNEWESPKNLEERTQGFLESKGLKSGKLFQSVRLALLGKGGGVGIFEVMSAIGKEESVRRIEALRRACD